MLQLPLYDVGGPADGHRAPVLVGNCSDLVCSLVSYNALTGHISPSALGWIVTFAPLGVVMWLSFGINRISEGHRQGAVLGLCRADGAVAVHDLPGLHRRLGGADFLRGGGELRGAEPLRLHHEGSLSGFGTFLIMGVFGLMSRC